MALQRRDPVAGGQDPVRVRPVQLRVRVDHLRLDPQAELHAAGPHVVGQLVQPARPDRLVDLPVAEAGPVAAAAGEPAVVEDVPFHAEAGGQVGQRRQHGEVVPEVHRFPHVQVHRARQARVRGPRAQVAVELRGQPVQPGPAGRQVHPGRGVGLPLGQGDLAGQQQLAAADGGQARQQPLGVAAHRVAGGHPLHAVHGVAAPRHVHPEHLTVAEPEPGLPGHHHGGRVVAGVTAAPLAQPQAVPQLMALRDPLGRRPAGEVEHLAGPAGQREDHVQVVDHVRLAAGVGQRVPGPDGAARYRLGLGHQPQARRRRPPPRPGPAGHRARPGPAGTAGTSPARRPGRARPRPAGGRTGRGGRTSPARARAAARRAGPPPAGPRRRRDPGRRRAPGRPRRRAAGPAAA